MSRRAAWLIAVFIAVAGGTVGVSPLWGIRADPDLLCSWDIRVLVRRTDNGLRPDD